MPNKALDGLRLLIVEDEFLIAMDAEQICRDHGATDAVIIGSVGELGADPFESFDFDVALIDVMVDGQPTLDFARRLAARKIPFIFATGYSHREDIFTEFSGVPVVGKPYSGQDLVSAITAALQRKKR